MPYLFLLLPAIQTSAKYSGKKCTYGTANKIGRHKNGVRSTVGRLRVKRENRSPLLNWMHCMPISMIKIPMMIPT